MYVVMRHIFFHGPKPHPVKAPVKLPLIFLVSLLLLNSILGLCYNQKTQIYSQGLINSEEIEFNSKDGTLISGDLYFPPLFSEDLAPSSLNLIIILHGYQSHRGTLTNEALNLAMDGYVVYTPDLRGHQKSEGIFTFGLQEPQDILEGLQIICDEFESIDPNNVGLLGKSFGGTIALLLCNQSSIFKSCVAMAPASNLSKLLQNNPGCPSLFGLSYNYRSTQENMIRNPSNPNNNYDQCSILLIHGEQDSLIDVSYSIEFYESFLNPSKDNLTILSDCNHRNVDGVEAQHLSCSWFDQKFHVTTTQNQIVMLPLLILDFYWIRLLLFLISAVIFGNISKKLFFSHLSEQKPNLSKNNSEMFQNLEQKHYLSDNNTPILLEGIFFILGGNFCNFLGLSAFLGFLICLCFCDFIALGFYLGFKKKKQQLHIEWRTLLKTLIFSLVFPMILIPYNQIGYIWNFPQVNAPVWSFLLLYSLLLLTTTFELKHYNLLKNNSKVPFHQYDQTTIFRYIIFLICFFSQFQQKFAISVDLISNLTIIGPAIILFFIALFYLGIITLQNIGEIKLFYTSAPVCLFFTAIYFLFSTRIF
ncbi:hypothetical protein NEF87_001833 [Candidatus Lokiarchaeum ossiferum]|uniref:Peptidase S9 prolyl oligopeptidase catalytic domain-containing protein n=1 Tax=Candidatus Lokiarchaeum ossiferum TaxID=2951803 RepID=A0ABY6HPV6_9ARCH|nr:hypothetical protein NEF87_001833 [Candidatus Lokiarchaeum sp. B-35]